MSSSEITRKSPIAITALNGTSSSPLFPFSSSSLSVYCVGFLSTTCISSPLLTSNTISPTSPNLFPLLLTTVFPMSCLENFLSSIYYHLYVDILFQSCSIFKLFCNAVWSIF